MYTYMYIYIYDITVPGVEGREAEAKVAEPDRDPVECES